jgi:glucosamine-6-phosphate deaminase
MNAKAMPVKEEKVDKLKVKVFGNRVELGNAAGEEAAARIRELIKEKGQIRMIFASAPSQNEFLARLSSADGIDWSKITAFHMDEYIGLEKNSRQLFSSYIMENLYSKVRPGNVHLIDSSNDPQEECKRYSELLAEHPIDIVCLGIGENGHLAFNDPPVANFADPALVKVVELDQECRQQQVNDGCFPKIEDVPTHAVTLTIPALMSGSFLFCMVPGPTKRNAVTRTLRGPVSTECPASILRTHENCTLFVDNQSFGG